MKKEEQSDKSEGNEEERWNERNRWVIKQCVKADA
jgi:hypothetical protein